MHSLVLTLLVPVLWLVVHEFIFRENLTELTSVHINVMRNGVGLAS